LLETRALLVRARAAHAETPGTGAQKDAAVREVLGLGGPPRGPANRALRARFHVVAERPLFGRWLQLTREECAANAGAPIPERLRTARRVALNTLSEELGDKDSDTTGRRLRRLKTKLREALEGECEGGWRTYFTLKLETLSDPRNPAYLPDGRDDL
jgi:hypothetical protein